MKWMSLDGGGDGRKDSSLDAYLFPQTLGWMIVAFRVVKEEDDEEDLWNG